MENNQDPQEMPESMMQQKEHEQGKQIGPVIGAIIIITILVIGGLYYWGAELNKQAEPSAEEIAAKVDHSTEALGTQGTSDEIAAIEEDLDLTDLGNLDAELGDIDAELGL